MSLPSHRRTSSDKRRRASHFALTGKAITTDPATQTSHLSHKAAPGATSYRGHTIHVKGKEKKLEKLLAKNKKTGSD